MALLRLLANVIGEDGKYLSRGSKVEESKLPEHIRNDRNLVSRELNEYAGKVLAMSTIVYDQAVKMADGSVIYNAATISPGATFKLRDIPQRRREHLVEGEHYLSRFTDQDIARVKQEAFKADQEAVFGRKGKEQDAIY